MNLFKNKMEENAISEKIILRDHLAIDRTKLANQRTLLAFLRTGLYLFVTALAVMKVEFLQELSKLGYVLIVLGTLTFLVGIINFVRMKKKIEEHYQENLRDTN